MEFSARAWFGIAVAAIVVLLGGTAGLVWTVDPYFHYRRPDADRFRYTLDNQRSQNDGIVRHFDYRALITGSSMTENFKASDVERLWGLKTVKVPFSGASFRELNRIVRAACDANPDLELVIVGLDFNKLIMARDWMRVDLGKFPDYLYDANPLNDVNYLLNLDAIRKSASGLFGRGITSFDAYSFRVHDPSEYGARSVLKNCRRAEVAAVVQGEYAESDRRTVAGNIEANILPMAAKCRKTVFFFTPYSAAWVYLRKLGGTYERQLAAERQFIEAILKCPNARLFSFNDRIELTGDLRNYCDTCHYGPWINTRILEWIRAGEGELTKDNYEAYLRREREVYEKFDFKSLFDL